jgi:succinate dehydrogenase / fumarate reductase, iron-sulfur subunit
MIEVRPSAEVPARAEPAAAGGADEPGASSVAQLRVFRGEPGAPSRYDEFDVPVGEGMVVLDALHWIQANGAPDLAVRWNCKAAKCGSCSAEVNGRPRLTCKTRLSDFDLAEPITVEPMRTFPLIRDLVTDVSWNYEVNRSIEPFSPPADVPQDQWRWQQEDIERVQEFRKCIECFLCQDVCHVLRNHETERPFMGPRFLVRAAGLEMHPIDQADRRPYLKDVGGVGYCNITKCCSEVCPEHIKITDNAIIPLKERVADEFYDPIQWAWRKLRGRSSEQPSRAPLPVLPAQAGTVELSPEPTPERLARAVGEDQPRARPARRASTTRAAPAKKATVAPPAASTPTEPAKVARAARATAGERPKRARRRPDSGDETPSEG